jgi:hypothetical protein
VFATASIGRASGLLEGNPHPVLTQLHGVAVTLGWSVAVTCVLLKLVGLLVPVRVLMQQELEGLDISQLGEALQQTSLSKYRFSAFAMGTIMSTTLRCSSCRLICLEFRRVFCARFSLSPQNGENRRIHNLLGDESDLARHLILPPMAVPAS